MTEKEFIRQRNKLAAARVAAGIFQKDRQETRQAMLNELWETGKSINWHWSVLGPSDVYEDFLRDYAKQNNLEIKE